MSIKEKEASAEEPWCSSFVPACVISLRKFHKPLQEILLFCLVFTLNKSIKRPRNKTKRNRRCSSLSEVLCEGLTEALVPKPIYPTEDVNMKKKMGQEGCFIFKDELYCFHQWINTHWVVKWCIFQQQDGVWSWLKINYIAYVHYNEWPEWLINVRM